jgi:hypothetical protein
MASARLEVIFNSEFIQSSSTCLLGGAPEPVYIPAGSSQPLHRIFYRHDYLASALHEVAHWCIAGKARRGMLDYGYWYEPDGRNQDQQREFERVEARPQALEWIFSHACGHNFRPSSDNLEIDVPDNWAFYRAIHHQVLIFCDRGLPPRAQRFHRVLCESQGNSPRLLPANFSLEQLQGSAP